MEVYSLEEFIRRGELERHLNDQNIWLSRGMTPIDWQALYRQYPLTDDPPVT